MSKDEALKMAIEAMETAEIQSEYDGLSNIIFKAIQACKEALEAEQVRQAQKPVAYWNGSTSFDYYKYDADGFIVSEFEIHDWKPLYTNPHQWQGLTDDEILAIPVGSRLSTARAIEQALKEKNHG
jgi:hypothetical protein